MIRRVAEVGDWVVGTGAINSPVGDVSGRVIYAMEVTTKMSMPEYDSYTRDHLPAKIPNWSSPDRRRRRGDSIYDFSVSPPILRASVHQEGNRDTDLRGQSVLLSDRFYYFGSVPVTLPTELQPIVKQGQGHRSASNDPYLIAFVRWIDGLRFQPNVPLHPPGMGLFKDDQLAASCAAGRRVEAEADELMQDRADLAGGYL